MSTMNATGITRRDLLKSGALVVGFTLIDPLSTAFGQATAHIDPYSNPDYLDPTQLDSWVAVANDGTVIVSTGKVDLGQGIQTALAQICADELDVPFNRVQMLMGDTAKTVDQGRTAGSNSIQNAGPQLRQACAAARLELIKMASTRLDVPSDRLAVVDGVISDTSNPATSVSYAALVGGKKFNVTIPAKGVQGALQVAPDVKAKKYTDYKVVGTSVKRVDLPLKLTAKFTYTPDVKVPGMLHGRVIRPAGVMSKPANVDQSSIANIKGVVKVVQEGSFLGVVAETEWAAIQAARNLKVTWSAPASKLPANPAEVDAYLENTKSFTDNGPMPKGNTDAAFAQAKRTFDATYHWAFCNHAMMMPSCAVADVQGDATRGESVTIWTGAQGPFTTRDRVSDMLGVPKRNVMVNYVESSGCYGRLTSDDAAEDAVLLSRAVGKPVRVQWSRQDEHIWEPKGPQQLMKVRAGVDANGKITAWEYAGRTFPWTEAQGTPQLGERQIGQKNTAPYPASPTGAGAVAQIYDIPNQKVTAAYIPWPQDDPTPLRTNPLRSPGEPIGWFASESFIDEIAAGLGVDPYQFRLKHLGSDQRATELLQSTAKQAGWKERPSPSPDASGAKATGRGIAIITRGPTLVAAVADVDVDRSSGVVTVKKMTMGHDCGLIINPDGLKFQIEANVMHGVSRALYEETKWDANGIKTVDWKTYPVITFNKVPDVDIVLINRPDRPSSGSGEPGIVPMFAAIANAIFDATGARLRQGPFTPERVKAAMQTRATSTTAKL
jgi:CO/xanthine dehydrogenase Mo-binding subunit